MSTKAAQNFTMGMNGEPSAMITLMILLHRYSAPQWVSHPAMPTRSNLMVLTVTKDMVQSTWTTSAATDISTTALTPTALPLTVLKAVTGLHITTVDMVKMLVLSANVEILRSNLARKD